ncbi:hypothetical protein AU476_35400 [Cupriavidus sp. UYMSc13B]|nr:hypothetical protein AU476_35400 [Cupriavidus sp. UYMSc13B]
MSRIGSEQTILHAYAQGAGVTGPSEAGKSAELDMGANAGVRGRQPAADLAGLVSAGRMHMAPRVNRLLPLPPPALVAGHGVALGPQASDRLAQLMAELQCIMETEPQQHRPPTGLRAPTGSPVLDAMSAVTNSRVRQWLADLNGIGVWPDPRFFNGILASCAYQVVRQHFKRRYKSSNKRHIPGTPAYHQERHARAQHFLGPLQAENRSLDDRLALGVGNCSEMASAAAELVLRCGAQARVWGACDPGRNVITHEFALVGPNLLQHSPDNFHNEHSLWVVDPWAGLCCPAPVYGQAFSEKMRCWAAEGKQVFHEQAWMRADDPRWIHAVVGMGKVLFQTTPADDPALLGSNASSHRG